MTPRIAIVSNRYPVDGHDAASPFVHDFCTSLQSLNAEVQVVTPYYPTDRQERDHWVTRFHWTSDTRVFSQLSLTRPADMVSLVRALSVGKSATREMVDSFKPQAILALWAIPSGWWAMSAARRLGIPYGIWALGTDIQVWAHRPIARGMIKRILRNAAWIYADGFALCDEVTKIAGRDCTFLPSQRVLADRPESDAPHPNNGDRYFLYFGRLAREKGVLDLLSAAEQLGHNSDFKIVFAGLPDGSVEVQQEISRRNLEQVCRYVGPLNPNHIFDYLRHAEAVVIPSHRDSIPLVLGEALQADTPVICSDLPDLCALLHRYHVGDVFETGNVLALARALETFKRPNELPLEITRFLNDFGPAAAAGRFLEDAAPTDLPAISARGTSRAGAEHA